MKKIILVGLLVAGCGGTTVSTSLKVPTSAPTDVEADRICANAQQGIYENVHAGDQINIRIGTNPYGLICVVPG